MKKAIATITITAIAIAGGATAASASLLAPDVDLVSTDSSLTSYEGKLPVVGIGLHDLRITE